MTYTVILPSIYQPYTDECLAGCKMDNVLVIDNTVDNLGVAASWNLGIKKMYDDNSDWLILLSAAIRFGEPGGLDLIEGLDTARTIGLEAGLGMGWHFLALRREVFDRVGTFDENFYPGYYEDIDFSWRLYRLYDNLPAPFWDKIIVDVSLAGWGHGVALSGIDPRGEQNKQYMLKKWGALAAPLYDYPFNDMQNSLKEWSK